MTTIDHDGWINIDVPADPYSIFIDTYHRLGDVLAEYGVGHGGVLSYTEALINRMVFTQQVSALEAYLSDTLVKNVLENDQVLERVLNGVREMKAKTVSLADIAKSPNIVTDSVKSHLQGILYHDLAKVGKYYEIALNINIWPDDELRKVLFQAILYRHDCVHRNGRTKDGIELGIFTSEYVNGILSKFKIFVEHIEGSVRQRLA